MMCTMVHVIRFQSLFKLIGITGSTFRSHCVASVEPMPKLKLFWNGILMRLATGFWVSLANFSVWASWSLAGSAACAVISTNVSKIGTKNLATDVTQAAFVGVFSIGFLFCNFPTLGRAASGRDGSGPGC